LRSIRVLFQYHIKTNQSNQIPKKEEAQKKTCNKWF